MLAANLWMPMPELWELRLGAVFLFEGELRARLSGWRAESGERRAESGERRAESGLTCGARFGLSRSGRDGSHIMNSKRGNLGVSVGCGKVFLAAVYGSWGEGIEVADFYGVFKVGH